MSELPVYGLGPEWEGPRVIMDFAFSDDEVMGVSMRHGGNVWGVGSQLIIKTSKPTSIRGGSLLEFVADYLWGKEDGDDWPPPHNEEDLELLERVQSEPGQVEIDGDTIPSRIVRDGKEWVARSEHQGRLITMHGHDFSHEGLRLFTMSESDWPRQPRDAPPL